MNVHYGSIRREPWMNPGGRWLFTDGQGLVRTHYHKPRRNTMEHNCPGQENVDVFRIIDVRTSARRRA